MIFLVTSKQRILEPYNNYHRFFPSVNIVPLFYSKPWITNPELLIHQSVFLGTPSFFNPWHFQLLWPKTYRQQFSNSRLQHAISADPGVSSIPLVRFRWSLRINTRNQKNGHVRSTEFADDLAAKSAWRGHAFQVSNNVVGAHCRMKEIKKRTYVTTARPLNDRIPSLFQDSHAG